MVDRAWRGFSDNFGVAGNWTTGVVPGVNDKAIIGDVATTMQPLVYAQGVYTIRQLEVRGGHSAALFIHGDLKVRGNGGSYGWTAIDAGATVSVLSLNGFTGKFSSLVENSGALNVAGQFSGSIHNYVGAMTTVTATGSFQAGQIFNYGDFIVDGYGASGLGGQLPEIVNFGRMQIAGTVGRFELNQSSGSGISRLDIGASPTAPNQAPLPMSALNIVGTFQATSGQIRIDYRNGEWDQLTNEGVTVLNGVEFVINAAPKVGGGFHKFSAGETLVLLDSDNPIQVHSSYFASVTNQHPRFSYYVGVLAGSDDVLFRALNSGATGGVATLDMSAGTSKAAVAYSAPLNLALVVGGIFELSQYNTSAIQVPNVTRFIGTKFQDGLTAVGATSSDDNLVFYGRAGDDLLTGGGGADQLYGEIGDDTLNGGRGIDTLRGGLNDDTYLVDVTADRVIELSGQGKDLVQSTAPAFTLPNHVEFLALMGSGNSRGTGNALSNVMTGNSGANVLDGKGANDLLIGGAGADTLIGDAGRDILTGGAHNDIFRFLKTAHSQGNLADIITDFGQAGSDRIDVSALVGPKLEYIHGAKFTKAGQVRINDVGGADVVVEVNTVGISGAELTIRLLKTSLASMSKTDFIL